MTRLLCLIFLMFLPVTAFGQTVEEQRYARSWLGQLQERSFRNNREYCGYLGYDVQGRFAATKPRRGRADSCDVIWSNRLTIIASYHTHGSFDPESYSEFPSTTDMETDREEGINGYVSTPGGRLWFIDSEKMISRQICGLGCLDQDPDFTPGLDGRIRKSYSHQDLLRIENGG